MSPPSSGLKSKPRKKPTYVTLCYAFLFLSIYLSFSYLFVVKHFWWQEPQGISRCSQGSPDFEDTTTKQMDIERVVAWFKYLVRTSEKTPTCVAVTPSTAVSTRQWNSGSHYLLVIKQWQTTEAFRLWGSAVYLCIVWRLLHFCFLLGLLFETEDTSLR
jgi:hypothetical protein